MVVWLRYVVPIGLLVVLAACGPSSLETTGALDIPLRESQFSRDISVMSDGKNGLETILVAKRDADGAYQARGDGKQIAFRVYDIDAVHRLVGLTVAEGESQTSYFVGRADGRRIDLLKWDVEAFAQKHVLAIQKKIVDGKLKGFRFGGDGRALVRAAKLLVEGNTKKEIGFTIYMVPSEEAATMKQQMEIAAIDAKPIDLWKRSWKPATSAQIQRLRALSPLSDGVVLDEETSAERLALPFYDDVELLRVVGSWRPKNLFLYFLQGSDGAMVNLNGTSPAIHAFNKKHPPHINAGTVRAYLWYFGFFVRAQEGPFLVVESPDDTFIPKGTSETDQATKTALREHPRKAVCVKEDGGTFLCDAMIFYSNAMFGAKMRVLQTGMVEMISDQPVAANLSIKINAPISRKEVSASFSQSKRLGEDALRLSELSGEPRRLAEQLFGGGTVEINRATIPFLSGISQRLIGRCTGAIDPSDRALLLRFGVSGASNLIFGGDYSNSDLRKGMGSLGSNVTLTAIGNKVGDTLRCTKSEAGRVAGLIARSVRANERAGVFMPSCQGSFTRQQCSCLAKIAAGVIPDIQRRQYHRGLIKEMIGRNPLLGFQVGLVCQITRY